MTAEEHVKMRPTELIHPDDHDSVISKMMSVVETKKPVTVQYRGVHVKKGYIWAESIASPIVNQHGDVEHILLSSRIIQEQKEHLDKITKSEEHYRTIIESSNEMVSIHDATGKITWVSPSVSDITGFSAKELLELPSSKSIYKDDMKKAKQAITTVLTMGVSQAVEVRLLTKYQGFRWFESRLTPVFNSSGDIEKMISVGRDIHDLKMREEELIKELEFINKTAALPRIGTYEITIEEVPKYLHVSDSFIELFGLNKNINTEKLGGAISELFEKDVFDRVNTQWLETIKGNRKEFDSSYWVTIADERRRLFRVRGIVKRDNDGNPLTMIGIVQDITEEQSVFENIINKRNQ